MFRAVATTSNAQTTPPIDSVSSPFVTTRVARREATLTSLEPDGLICAHSGPLKTGSEVPVTVTGRGHSFSALGVVVSCRVAALGAGEAGAPLFRSHLRLALNDEARMLLHFLMEPTR